MSIRGTFGQALEAFRLGQSRGEANEQRPQGRQARADDCQGQFDHRPKEYRRCVVCSDQFHYPKSEEPYRFRC